jgi:hypothetical protein
LDVGNYVGPKFGNEICPKSFRPEWRLVKSIPVDQLGVVGVAAPHGREGALAEMGDSGVMFFFNGRLRT